MGAGGGATAMLRSAGWIVQPALRNLRAGGWLANGPTGTGGILQVIVV